MHVRTWLPRSKQEQEYRLLNTTTSKQPPKPYPLPGTRKGALHDTSVHTTCAAWSYTETTTQQRTRVPALAHLRFAAWPKWPPLATPPISTTSSTSMPRARSSTAPPTPTYPPPASIRAHHAKHTNQPPPHLRFRRLMRRARWQCTTLSTFNINRTGNDCFIESIPQQVLNCIELSYQTNINIINITGNDCFI